MLSELKIGSLVIANDLLGFVIEFDDSSVTLNTKVGVRKIVIGQSTVVLAQPEEIVDSVIRNIKKVINH